MLHGNPTWSFFYRNLVLGLKDAFRCLALDNMGCGLSDKPQKYEYTLHKHIDNLSRWIETVLPPAGEDGGKFNLIVHDWGGPIGIGYAARHPERIRRIVVLNTSAFTAGTMPFRIRLCRTPFLGAFLVRGLNAFAGLATRMTTKTPLPPGVRKGFLLPYDSWANRVAVHKFVMDIPLQKDTPAWDVFRKTESLLPHALKDKPMLIQWGMRDWCFTPFFLRLWKERFPDAEADEYDAGHYLLEDAGGAIIPRVRSFLERPLP
jgi:haloalkane dehalogenase